MIDRYVPVRLSVTEKEPYIFCIKWCNRMDPNIYTTWDEMSILRRWDPLVDVV